MDWTPHYNGMKGLEKGHVMMYFGLMPIMHTILLYKLITSHKKSKSIKIVQLHEITKIGNLFGFLKKISSLFFFFKKFEAWLPLPCTQITQYLHYGEGSVKGTKRKN